MLNKTQLVKLLTKTKSITIKLLKSKTTLSKVDSEESDEKYLKKNEMMAMKQKLTKKRVWVEEPDTKDQYYKKIQITPRERVKQKRKTSKAQKNKNYFSVKLF